jgi:hypothetical protein
MVDLVSGRKLWQQSGIGTLFNSMVEYNPAAEPCLKVLDCHITDNSPKNDPAKILFVSLETGKVLILIFFLSFS